MSKYDVIEITCLDNNEVCYHVFLGPDYSAPLQILQAEEHVDIAQFPTEYEANLDVRLQEYQDACEKANIIPSTEFCLKERYLLTDADMAVRNRTCLHDA